MNSTILILGFLFGAILQYANLNKFNVISGLALRENFAVPKAIALSIGIGIILLSIEIALGMASYHVKPFILLFGARMAGAFELGDVKITEIMDKHMCEPQNDL